MLFERVQFVFFLINSQRAALGCVCTFECSNVNVKLTTFSFGQLDLHNIIVFTKRSYMTKYWLMVNYIFKGRHYRQIWFSHFQALGWFTLVTCKLCPEKTIKKRNPNIHDIIKYLITGRRTCKLSHNNFSHTVESKFSI